MFEGHTRLAEKTSHYYDHYETKYTACEDAFSSSDYILHMH